MNIQIIRDFLNHVRFKHHPSYTIRVGQDEIVTKRTAVFGYEVVTDFQPWDTGIAP